MIRTTLRRALLPVGLIAGAVAAVTAIAALAGASPERAVAIGLYAVGSFQVLVGFALGSRNVFRSRDPGRSDPGEDMPGFWETSEASALLIVLGLVLLVVGTAVDPRARLV